MTTTLDEQYFTWLYSQVCSVRLKNPSRTYYKLLGFLHSTKFLWQIPNDDNREADGKALRDEFLESEEIEDVDPSWLDLECSMLEMLIALSRHLSFEDQAEGEVRDWFWQMIDNLDLYNISDRAYGRSTERLLREVCNAINYRTYLPSGRGGLFPLRQADEDQTKVELWYQMSAYLLEHS